MTANRIPALRGQKTAVSLAALGLVCALGLGGCSTVKNALKKPDAEDRAVASQGQRLSILAFEQKLEPSKALKGVGYYLPPVQPVASWPTAAGPADTVVQNADAAKAFRVAWTKSIGAGSKDETEVLAQPVSDGRLIYTLDGQARVSAFDVNTGAQAWSVDFNPHVKRDKVGFGGGLALSPDGKLYVTSGYRFIAALDAGTGKTLWKKAVDTQLHSAPAVGDKYVYVTDVDNQIFAFSAADGEMNWTYQAIAEPARILKAGAPVVADGMVYAPFSSGELVALNADTGQAVWDQVLAQSTRTNALSEIRDISGRPVLYNGTVFAASHSGVFQAMNTKTGEPLWTVHADSLNSPWVAGDVVYLIDLQGELICASRDSGQVYWIKDLNAALPKAEKTTKGLFGLGGGKKKTLPQWTGPFMASDRLVVLNSLGQAVTLDPKTGAQTASLNLGGAAYIAPIAVGNKLFVVTSDGKLVAIG
jgi:outer membrane protein assembly factor BamB